VLAEATALDEATYEAVADTPTPTLDGPMTRLSNAANHSLIWIVIGAALALLGGRPGRRAAVRGLAAIGVASFTANVAVKGVVRRRRPRRLVITAGRDARMPGSSSFPSGHAASAFAFATAVTAELPQLSLPLYGLATAVAYSRVHTGVHFPSDVMAGAVLGSAVGTGVSQASRRLGPVRHRPPGLAAPALGVSVDPG